MFSSCYSLTTIPMLNIVKVTSSSYINGVFSQCRSLTRVGIINMKQGFQLNYSALLSKESLLYMINNEALSKTATIKLEAYAYDRLANDADVVAALANHPNISLTK